MFKKIFYFIISLGMLAACGKADKNKSDESKPAKLSGEIKNVDSGYVYVKKPTKYETKTIDSTKINDKGEFSLSIDNLAEKGGIFKIHINDQYTNQYLVPGYDLTMKLDFDKFDESLKYSGKGAVPNNFFAEKERNDARIQNSFKKNLSLGEKDYKDKMDSIKKRMKNKMEKAIKKADLPEKFKKFANADIFYTWVRKLNVYPKYKQRQIKSDSSVVSEDYYSFLDKVDLNKPELLKVDNYRRFISSRLSKKAMELYRNDSTLQENGIKGYYTARFETCKDLFTQEDIRNRMLTNILKRGLSSLSPEDMQGLIAEYKKLCTDDSCIENVEEKAQNWAHLKSGKD
ncbi:MAG: hypothetical protein ABEH43_01360, partial [Flavobacteriales bacterium]